MRQASKIPRLVIVYYRSVRELLKPGMAVLCLIGPITVWLVTCIVYARNFPTADEGPPRFWGLGATWKANLEEYRSWVAEIGAPLQVIRFSPHEVQDTARYFLGYAQRLIAIHTRYTMFMISVIILLLATMVLNRLFYQGELHLYLVRPLDIAALLFGKFFALLTVIAVIISINRMLLLVGGFGEDWLKIKTVILNAAQTDLALSWAILAVPFLIAPIASGLFRGAGVFIISACIVFLVYYIPAADSWYHGVIPYRFSTSDPVLHKLTVVFQSVFTLPLPRIFFAQQGFKLALMELKGQASLLAHPLLLEVNSGYWWWSFSSGLAYLLGALVVWSKKEQP